jgi:two-component system chemotaxis response regulator CheB
VKKNIIVIGASAGGIEIISKILRGLPQNFAASIFIVLHTGPHSPRALDLILSRSSALPVKYVYHHENIRAGQVYLPLPDHHLVIDDVATVCVSRAPRENRFRPAVDPLFRSAAQKFGSQVVGVILTGGLDDGTAGLQVIKQRGGTAIVQDPQEAENPSMPRSALKHVDIDHCVPSVDIAALLIELAQQEAAASSLPASEELNTEVDIALEHNPIDAGVLKLGKPSIYTCPECHGALLEVDRSPLARYRCHTGHAFTAYSLVEEIDEKIENALWEVIRILDEHMSLLRQLAEKAHENGDHATAEHYFDHIEYTKKSSGALRQITFRLHKLEQKLQ